MWSFGLKAWPSRWLTPINGTFKDDASDFAKFKPTLRHIINPGPDVAATADTSLRLIPLSVSWIIETAV